MIPSDLLEQHLRILQVFQYGLKNGLSLRDVFDILEDSPTLKSPLGQKYQELIFYLQENGGARPPHDWNGSYFLPSTKMLFSLGWMMGLLDSSAGVAYQLLLCRTFQNTGSDGLLFQRYFIELLRQGTPLPLLLEVLSSEWDEHEVKAIVSDLQKVMQTGESLVPIFEKHQNFIGHEFSNCFQKFEKSGEMVHLTDYLQTESQRSWFEEILKKSRIRGSDGFYKFWGDHIQNGESLIHGLQQAIQRFPDFRNIKIWQDILGVAGENFDDVISAIDKSSLSRMEKAFVNTGLRAGILPEILKDLDFLIRGQEA